MNTRPALGSRYGGLTVGNADRHLLGVLRLQLAQVSLTVSEYGSNNRLGRLGALGIHGNLRDYQSGRLRRLYLNLVDACCLGKLDILSGGGSKVEVRASILAALLYSHLQRLGLLHRDLDLLA